MAKSTAGPSSEILAAALQGLEAQREKLDQQISQVRALIGRRPGRPGGGLDHSAGSPVARKKRILTPEARKRIAAAQKRRWAALRKSQA